METNQLQQQVEMVESERDHLAHEHLNLRSQMVELKSTHQEHWLQHNQAIQERDFIIEDLSGKLELALAAMEQMKTNQQCRPLPATAR